MGVSALLASGNTFLQSTWLLESLFSILYNGLWALVGGVCDAVTKVCNINVPFRAEHSATSSFVCLEQLGVSVLINMFCKQKIYM